MTTTDDAPEIVGYPARREPGRPLDPAPILTELRNRATLTRVRIWDGSTPWLVTKYEEQRAALTDPRLSSNIQREGYPRHNAAGGARALPIFVNLDPPEHGAQRRVLSGSFSVKGMEAMRPRISELVDGLIDDLLCQGPGVDLLEQFALPLPSLVICELLGVPYEGHGFFQEHSKIMISTSSTKEQGAAATAELKSFVSGLVDARFRQPQGDLISKLAATVATGDLTREQAIDLAMLLLFAGHETSANMIALGILTLILHPQQREEIRTATDPAVVAGAVEELLRYLTVAHTGRRRVAVEDIELGGATIRAGEGVILAGEVGNRDEHAFDGDPDQLDIHRNSRHHMAFGYGIHQCLGQPLARIELQVAFTRIFQRIPTLSLAVGMDELEFREDAGVVGLLKLPVTW